MASLAALIEGNNSRPSPPIDSCQAQFFASRKVHEFSGQTTARLTSRGVTGDAAIKLRCGFRKINHEPRITTGANKSDASAPRPFGKAVHQCSYSRTAASRKESLERSDGINSRLRESWQFDRAQEARLHSPERAKSVKGTFFFILNVFSINSHRQ